MQQTITDPIAFLTEAREAVEALSLLKDREAHLETEEKRLDKALETEKKMVSDSINQTIKQRLDELTLSYDKEIGKGQDKLKKARIKREKAKNQGMKDRIEEETAELHAYNRELKLQIKTLFQKKGVPSFCNSDWYYSLYFTRGIREAFRLLITIAVCFWVIPYGLYYFVVPEKKPLYLACIYVADILVFGGLYILISNKTKLFYTDTLKKGRTIRDQINANKKKIRVIVHTIKKDRNESVYDLEKYDDEIAQVEQSLAETAGKKRDALNTFDHVTRTIISDEISNNHKEKLESITKQLREIRDQLEAVDQEAKQKNLIITDRYSVYLGREFLDPLKIGELADLLKTGSAANLSEAIQQYKEKRA
ncbi:MAG: hypothetical protein ACLTKI_03195 [Lachnospiraceae bacterium]